VNSDKRHTAKVNVQLHALVALPEMYELEVGACQNVLLYMSLPDSTPQRHAAAIQRVKLSHYVYFDIGSFAVGIHHADHVAPSIRKSWH
jgi:hypothetical protein